MTRTLRLPALFGVLMWLCVGLSGQDRPATARPPSSANADWVH